MLDHIKERLEVEIEKLQRELNFELPDRIKKAVELGDLRENAEYKSALERQQFVQARIGHLQKRMSELSKINVEAMPADKVGFGSRVKVLNVAMEMEDTFTIVAGDFMDLDSGQVSMASPIGRGLLGAREGDEVTISLPVGERTFRILELVTLSMQLDMAEE
jgi:transcription elongation factor GreA